MRRWIAAVIGAAVAFGAAGAAMAAFTQTARVAFTTHRSGSSTGIVASLAAADPTAPGGKPAALTDLVLAFPAHTVFQLSTAAARSCRLTDRQLIKPFGPTCPRRSRIGYGTAVANASPISAAIKAPLRAYVHGRRELILILHPALPGAAPIVIHAVVAGSELRVHVPKLIYGASPAEKFEGVSAVLVSLKLTVPVLGAGRRALITAGRCSAGRFQIVARLRYADHRRLVLRSSSACR